MTDTYRELEAAIRCIRDGRRRKRLAKLLRATNDPWLFWHRVTTPDCDDACCEG